MNEHPEARLAPPLHARVVRRAEFALPRQDNGVMGGGGLLWRRRFRGGRHPAQDTGDCGGETVELEALPVHGLIRVYRFRVSTLPTRDAGYAQIRLREVDLSAEVHLEAQFRQHRRLDPAGAMG